MNTSATAGASPQDSRAPRRAAWAGLSAASIALGVALLAQGAGAMDGPEPQSGALTTRTGTAPAVWAGATTTSFLADLLSTSAACVVPNSTRLTSVRWRPLITTLAPPLVEPDEGASRVMDGFVDSDLAAWRATVGAAWPAATGPAGPTESAAESTAESTEDSAVTTPVRPTPRG